jgi:predicted O-methyltransferase YrrM
MTISPEQLEAIAFEAVTNPGLKAHQVIPELAELLGLIASQQPEVYVEIGTYYGGGTWAVQQAVPNARLICIDNDSLDSGLSAKENLRALGVKATVIEADSQDAGTLAKLRKLVDRVDFLFIDGDHHEGPVRRDFALYSPLVGAGGVVALHDIHSRHPDDHVGRLWAELLEGDRRTGEIHAGVGWGGVGLVWV